MKKSLLISASLLTLSVVTGIYAQTTTGTSIVEKMKAAAQNFTLSALLNPGETGLQSAPIKGKKTGDILTAGEYNRILELLSEGGGGGGAGWVDVPLTDTNPFEIDNCEYRFRMSGVAGNGVIPGFSQTHWYYVTYKSADAIANAAWVYLRSGNKQTVYVIDTSNNGVLNVTAAWGWRATKIEKLCGGIGGAGGGKPSRASLVRNIGVSLAPPTGMSEWPDSIICTFAPGENYIFDFYGTSGGKLVGYWTQDGIGTYFNFDGTFNTSQSLRGDPKCGSKAANIKDFCAEGRCLM